MEIKVKLLSGTALLPTKADAGSAGYDLYYDGPTVIIEPSETKFLSTGLAMAIPSGYAGMIYARSGLACKKGLRPANCVGVIDPSYRGEVIVALHNDSEEARVVVPGDRIAQMLIELYFIARWQPVDELDDTERGEGGFGSSGS